MSNEFNDNRFIEAMARMTEKFPEEFAILNRMNQIEAFMHEETNNIKKVLEDYDNQTEPRICMSKSKVDKINSALAESVEYIWKLSDAIENMQNKIEEMRMKDFREAMLLIMVHGYLMENLKAYTDIDNAFASAWRSTQYVLKITED